MYIEIINKQVERQWLSKPAIYKDKTDAQLEALGIYSVETPVNTDPYNPVTFTISVANQRPVVNVTMSSLSLAQAKLKKLAEIKAAWKRTLTHGKFISVAVAGFEVDCRRFDVDNDQQNIAGKIKRIEADIEQAPVNWKGVSETRSLTLAELRLIELEMLDYANTSYAKKFIAGMAIDAAIDIEAIKAVSF